MRLSLLSILLFFCLAAGAQISITSADMPAVGDTFYAHQDTSVPGFSIGQSGANRTWDFSNLQPNAQVTTYAIAPSATPYSADFPNANLALTNDFNAFLYYRNTAQALKAEGFASIDPNLGTVSVNFNPIPDQYQFPIEYLKNFSGSSGFVEAKPYGQLPSNIQQQIDQAISGIPGATVQQVRVTFTSNYKDTIDAWGAVTTPLGTYEALRRKRIESSVTKIEAQVQLLFPPAFWQEIANVPSTTTEHSWLAKNTGMPLVTLGYDSLRNIISASYSSIPPPPTANFSWVNTSGGLVNFTDNSQNNPTSYSWDFGDGSNSTQQNPSHVYSANGAYYVCLTVSSGGGSDTFCDSVQVTGITPFNNPPIAVRDTGEIVYPTSLTLNVLDNDLDPDNDNITLSLILTQPLNGNVTDAGNGIIDYEANATFRGIDSFTYEIVDDGSPVKKDTGTVVIRVNGPPFANFSFTASGFDVTFQNISSGADSVFWNLDDGTTATTNTVVHTFARGAYNVCIKAINDFGEDTMCKTVDLTQVGIDVLPDNAVRIYPNPAAYKVMIETTELAGDLTVALYNSIGVRVLQQDIAEKRMQLDISALPAGVYGMQFINAAGQTVLTKSLLISK